MRHLSTPQLEVQAEVMAVKLREQIVKEHEVKIKSCNLGSDSMTVLQWIHNFHRKQQVFVANRVTEILDTTDVSRWKHVRVSTTQRNLAPEQPTLKSSREVSCSLCQLG